MGEVPFNRPRLIGTEHRYVDEAIATGKISGNGMFARRCTAWLCSRVGSLAAFLTPSCTAALEMAAILADIGPGDEVIVPTFTFVSTANAFASRGATPVFVDLDERTLNLEVAAVERAITSRTRAIVVMHYGGVACDMDAVMTLAARHRLLVIEDAAHALPAARDGRPLGSIGHLATFSFHETKNIQCGEGGALLVNDASLVRRAEIVQEKGTNRSSFFRGEADRYTWLDLGSSYLLSEISAAFLWAQIEQADATTAERRRIWSLYHDAFEDLEQVGLVRRPGVPHGCDHSGHLYYLLLGDERGRDALIAALARTGVHAVFHYVPLGSSPGGRRFGREPEPAVVAESLSRRLVRLPLWVGMEGGDVAHVVDGAHDALTADLLRHA
ncbi:MAG TPA: dTDP-4-amino-4,6-dideoxygalactose transaminase [Conexibacter sp.]|jgi:dTDP-4-amino-4,6-dideoxygalactose transaminase|nr:dTDP-4-amino-4,6-dideoxygalactose transaminase [Conexibacter sp.]